MPFALPNFAYSALHWCATACSTKSPPRPDQETGTELPPRVHRPDGSRPNTRQGDPDNPTSSVPKKFMAGASAYPAFRNAVLESKRQARRSDSSLNVQRGSAASTRRVDIDELEGEALLKHGETIRADLQACKLSGDYSEFGTVLYTDDGIPIALQFHAERAGDFRALVALSQEQNNHGEGIFVGSAEKYRTCVMLTSLDGEAACAVMPDQRLISAIKKQPGSPPDAPRHRIPDLLDIALDRFRSNHLVCFGPKMANLYAKLGFEPVAIWPEDPSVTIPKWSDKGERQFRRYDRKDEQGRQIGLAIIFMALNRNKREQGAEMQTYDDVDLLNCTLLATTGQTPEAINAVWDHGYGLAAARAADKDMNRNA